MDMLLMLVGLLLVLAGLGVFLFGRSRSAHAQEQGEGKRNVVSIFGISIDVTNPSILVIIMGVAMMLTPYFAPMEEGDRSLKTAMADLLGREPPGGEGEAAPVSPPVSMPASGDAPHVPSEPPRVTAAVGTVAADFPVNTMPATAAGSATAASPMPMPVPARPSMVATAPAPLQVALLDKPASPAFVQTPALRIGILTEAFNYENAAEPVLRDKMKTELHGLVSNMVSGDPILDHGNQGFRRWFRKGVRESSIQELCRRTDMDRLLLADLTPVTVPGTTESGNWPDMRYTLIDCKSRHYSQSATMRMEPVARDHFPMQISLQRTARRFIHEHRYLLEQ